MLETLHSEIPESQISLSYPQLIALANRYNTLYPETMNILDIAGVSPFGSREMTNPYTNTLDAEDFSNIGRHCMAVAYTAEKIAMNLLSRGLILENQVDEIIQAAMLHDGDKRIEIMRKKAAKAGTKDENGNSIDVYGEAGYATIGSIFSDVGVDPEILSTIKNMGGMTGHNSLVKFIHVENSEIILDINRTLAEMIVHIADDMTHSPNPDTTNPTIITSLAQRATLGKFSERYAFLWNEGLLSHANGRFEHTKNLNIDEGIQDQKSMNYYAGMEIVFRLICNHLQEQLDPTSLLDSVEYIVGLANKNTGNTQEGVSEKVEAITNGQ